ncbi:MAG: hypothetical protein WBV56_12960, partial [Azonexus sp.]
MRLDDRRYGWLNSAPNRLWIKMSLIAAVLILGGQFAHAEGVSGEIQVVGYISKDKSVQRSLSTV